jgi:hypothetical protein
MEVEAMRQRSRFRPGPVDGLERRALLTHGGTIAPPLIGTLSPVRPSSGVAQIYSLVNASFDRFTQDFQQAQSTYLSMSTPEARRALMAFTSQRVGLLKQELIRTLSRLPGSYAKASKNDPMQGTVLQVFMLQTIQGGGGSLATNLKKFSIPPVGATGASATLYNLAASNAIETARTATINGLKYLINTPKKH